MKTKKVAESLKNAVSTVFLLAGAFFVCSTFLSMRAVFADPVAPVIDPSLMTPQAQRAGANARTSGRASPRNRQASQRTTVARSAIVNAARNQATNSRGVASRSVTSRSNVQNPRQNAVSSRNVNSAVPTRNVVSRQNAATNRANATRSRTVRARTATTDAATNARISLQGSAIRGSKSTPASTYSYLNAKLYTGNYSNIIDSTTGLISTDAFNNCMESYYTCMDEICTARNQAQRRCGCAGRVKAFAEAEAALETANEELIKVSGELALLVANKGKDVSEAFQLTDAEKVMNCVSWQDITNQYGTNSAKAIEWCSNHGIYNNGAPVTSCTKPSYCEEEGNNFGFDVTRLDGSGSDILASLKSWADAKDKTVTILTGNEDNLLSSFGNVSNIVSGMAGIGTTITTDTDAPDSLATKWGYELFKHAHNEVCGRVLDSCFNGIYESCGTPPSGGRCATSQTSNCPYNYNSRITLTSDNEINLLERSNAGSVNASAACFGYTNTSGDPYSNLRGPVADARRSIMNKYLLDANADCDLYGEQLRQTAQNIGYQKVAAQQALQQKRLEFAVEEKESTLASADKAIANFNECMSEIYDCYESTADSEPNWPDARIKTYCAQIANVPHCYEEMICNPSSAQFRAVIDSADNTKCFNSQDYTKNTCRNVVTLNEILNGTGAQPADIVHEAMGSSAAMREKCLIDVGIGDIRAWSSNFSYEQRCSLGELPKNAVSGYKTENGNCVATKCNDGYLLQDGNCDTLAETDCTSEIPNAAKAIRTLDGNTWSSCTLKKCNNNYTITGNKCVAETTNCSNIELNALNATDGIKTWNGTSWDECVATKCVQNYILDEGKCVIAHQKCTLENAKTAQTTYNANTDKYENCIATECNTGYSLDGGKCVKDE